MPDYYKTGDTPLTNYLHEDTTGTFTNISLP